MTKELFERMKSALVEAAKTLLADGIQPFLSGSFAICMYAGKPLGDPQDIDFLFKTRDEHDKAVALLERESNFELIKEIVWESNVGDESVNTKLVSSDGIEFDLAYTVSDIDLDYDPTRTIFMADIKIPILSLEDMKKSYLRFSHDKPGAEAKIALIEDQQRINKLNLTL